MNHCEKGFSTHVYIKNKYRNRLQVVADLRNRLSNMNPLTCPVWHQRNNITLNDFNELYLLNVFVYFALILYYEIRTFGLRK